MVSRKLCQVWLHFSQVNANYARCSICDKKCKAGPGNVCNLRKHQVKDKIKAEKCTVFNILKKAKSPTAAAANVSMLAASAEEVEPSGGRKDEFGRGEGGRDGFYFVWYVNFLNE